MSAPELDLTLHVRCDRHAPAVVRASLQHCAGIGWSLGDAMLIASELVTNAVLHSGAGRDDLVEVRVSSDEDRLRVTVRDPGKSGEVELRADDEAGGMGLQIVEQLANRWGAERDRGHLVWAELPAPERESVTT